ncbi:MAG: hypothetical protein ACTHOB_18410 [Ginsengibacter sp.]
MRKASLSLRITGSGNVIFALADFYSQQRLTQWTLRKMKPFILLFHLFFKSLKMAYDARWRISLCRLSIGDLENPDPSGVFLHQGKRKSRIKQKEPHCFLSFRPPKKASRPGNQRLFYSQLKQAKR